MTGSSQSDTPRHDANDSFGRVLLVDAAGPFREAATQFLCEAGYDCQGIDDTEDARRILASEHCDLLITDMGLADGEGIELVRYAMTTVPGMPVIAVTESPSIDSAIQAVELPVVAYLLKSTPIEVIHDKIRSVLANSGNRKTVLRLQRLLRQCADDLDGSRVSPQGKGNRPTRVPLSTLRALAGCLGELVALEQDVDATGQIGRMCELLQCPIWRVQRNAIHKCILLLQETKRRFKSKELAQVRATLEHLLKTLP